MRLISAFALSCALAFGTPAVAQQDSTLADIRAELSVLFNDILLLKEQLDPTGLREMSGSTADTTLDQVIALEKALQALTARTEELEFRIGQVVADGTNRIGDLEFRVCELEPGCEIGALGDTLTLGGLPDEALSPVSTPATPDTEGLAVTEKSDFERAQTAYEEERYQEAAGLFKEFLNTYPGGPLGISAQLGLGQSLERLGQPREAARAFLDGFSLNPSGQDAPFALFKLGSMLSEIGQIDEACVMLGEVGRRFPQDNAALLAQDQMAVLGCS